MPSNVVDTKEDEKKWEKAKEKAKEQGHGDDHGYIMSIYKNMCPSGVDDSKLPDHCSDKSSSKCASLRRDLIKLGEKRPDLRDHLSVVIEGIEKWRI